MQAADHLFVIHDAYLLDCWVFHGFGNNVGMNHLSSNIPETIAAAVTGDLER
jgi:hypothetical protein